MKLRNAARQAAAALDEAGVPEAAFEAELLARSAAGVDRAAYFAGAEAGEAELDRLRQFVARRKRREPAAFITGEREFYGRVFAMGPGALIPRPETEMLVELALEELDIRPTAIVVDVGTGSGCVAVSVAAERPSARVVGLDVSEKALEVALENAAKLAPRVTLLQADLVSGLQHADVVLANLPYIPSDEIDALEPEVSKWEPRVALDGGEDGFTLIRRLVVDCATRVRPGVLALEVGFGQAGEAVRVLGAAGAIAEVRKDLSGIDRIVIGRWR